MVLSPQDIHNKEFSVKMRGYNIDEVNEFLDRIIKDYQLTLAENEKLKQQVSSADEQLKYFNGMKDSLNQSIIVAQNAADKLKNDAQAEAKKVSEQSRKQADEILNNASDQAKQIVENISDRSKSLLTANEDLKNTTESFRSKLVTLLQSQMDLVNSDEWDKVINGVDNNYKNVEKQINDLDSFKDSVVKSESNEVSLNKTVTIYPDGSYKVIE